MLVKAKILSPKKWRGKIIKFSLKGVSSEPKTEYCTVSDIEKIYSVGKAYIRKLIIEGEITAIKIGQTKGGYRIKKKDFEEYFENLKTKTSTSKRKKSKDK